jgi:hypothetical protein
MMALAALLLLAASVCGSNAAQGKEESDPGPALG